MNWSGTGFAVTHSMTTENIQDVLPLGKKQCVLAALHSHTEKEIQGPKVLHSEFLFQCCNDMLKELRRGRREHNVINIQEQVNSVVVTAVDEPMRCLILLQ
jgi:hypothetical protein